MPDRLHWLQVCHEWFSQPAFPAMLPHFPAITQEEITQMESLLMPPIRRGAISEQSIIPLRGKNNVFIYSWLI